MLLLYGMPARLTFYPFSLPHELLTERYPAAGTWPAKQVQATVWI